eukprot:RCo017422
MAAAGESEQDLRIRELERLLKNKEEELRAVQSCQTPSKPAKRPALKVLHTAQRATRKGGADVAAASSPRQLSGNAAGEIEAVAKLEEAVKAERLRRENTAKELRAVATQLRARDKEMEKVVAQLEEIRSATGWTKSGPSRSNTPQSWAGPAASDGTASVLGLSPRAPGRFGPGVDNRVAEMQQLVEQLESELKTERQIQRKKTQLIESLSQELEGKKKLEEELLEARNQIKVRERELKDALGELKILSRTQAKQDKLLNSLELGDPSRDQAHRVLEQDKKYLLAENARLTEARRQLERITRAQQAQISRLQAQHT